MDTMNFSHDESHDYEGCSRTTRKSYALRGKVLLQNNWWHVFNRMRRRRTATKIVLVFTLLSDPYI